MRVGLQSAYKMRSSTTLRCITKSAQRRGASQRRSRRPPLRSSADTAGTRPWQQETLSVVLSGTKRATSNMRAASCRAAPWWQLGHHSRLPHGPLRCPPRQGDSPDHRPYNRSLSAHRDCRTAKDQYGEPLQNQHGGVRRPDIQLARHAGITSESGAIRRDRVRALCARQRTRLQSIRRGGERS